jgi:hypothetical protein
MFVFLPFDAFIFQVTQAGVGDGDDPLTIFCFSKNILR